ncbi:putative ABC transport system permease protein [Rhodoligotrophos appendicifer]|uniref:ABC transporter permease n=1 Tax=Rhodoligotrophos appendicifer TaxID=987056 RepID=UPI0011851421|nr:FtsX-like permease family protein [Rhodoligotrophos appendicifer]
MTISETGALRANEATSRPTGSHAFGTSVRVAMRELRSGLQGFWIFLSCLILGVAALASVQSVSTAIEGGLAERGQTILGGDAEFTLVHREAGAPEQALLRSRGQVSELFTLRAMARAVNGDGRTLVEAKAVDDAYPLFGEVRLANDAGFDDALAFKDGHWGAVADPILLTRIGAKEGDLIQIGSLQLQVRAPVVNEPDRLSDGLMFGPRLFMTREALLASGLVQPGSLITRAYRIKLNAPNDDAALGSFLNEVRETFPDAGWRIKSRQNAAPGVQRFIDRLTLFLSLVGLTALFVGGVGIANAVTNFLDGRRRNIAILKCLGAPGRAIFQIYLIQVLILAALGIMIGVSIGAIVPFVLQSTLQDILPLPLEAQFYPMPLLAAATFGVLVTLAFAIWPLGRARDLPAQALFRDAISPSRSIPRIGYIIATVIVLVLLIGLALLTFPDRMLTLWYAVGLAVAFVILVGMGRALMWASARIPFRRGPILRLAISNLHRPAAPTVSVVLSLGLGLSLFVTLAMVDDNLTRELQRNVPGQAPSFFFLDIQPDQHDRFEQMLTAEKGAHDVQSVPMLRGQVSAVNGVPAREVKADPEVAWVLRGDRGLTYSETPPANAVITQGEWWPPNYEGEPLVSMAEEAAQGIGLTVGDSITVNVLGREITAKIASLRQVEWRSLSMNFVLVFSPNALRGAPHTFLVTVKASTEDEPRILKTMSDAFTNVTAVRVKEALDTVNELMSQLLLAVRGANAVTLLVGILVLAGAMATGLRTRIYDAVVLKTFGASRHQLLAAYALEYALLGLVTALFALIAGTLASLAIVQLAMQTDWSFVPEVAFTTAFLATVLTISAGLITTWSALRAKASPILRNE